MAGPWHWTCDVDLPNLPSFPTQADAEAWLASAYEELVDQGASEVTLREGERPVYGPMSLDS